MGATVIAVDLDISKIPETPKIQAYQLDVTDWHGMKKMYETIVEKHGRIDVVCNNAGIYERIWLFSRKL